MATVTRYVRLSSSGGDGTANTDGSGGTHAYKSIVDWYAWAVANYTDIHTATTVLECVCSIGTANSGTQDDLGLTPLVLAAPLVTGANGYVIIRGSDPIGSAWTPTAYSIKGTSGVTWQVSTSLSYTSFRNLQIDNAPSNAGTYGGRGIGITYGAITQCEFLGVRVRNSYTGDNSSGTYGQGITTFTTSDAHVHRVYNCVVYDFTTTVGDAPGTGIMTGYSSSQVLNCTVVNCARGYQSAYGETTYKNCIAEDCTDGYVGGGKSGSTKNQSDIASDAPGTSAITTDVVFANKAGKDFALAAADAAVIGQGVDLSGTFTTDITGATRTTWDLGAVLYVATGGVTSYRLYLGRYHGIGRRLGIGGGRDT